MNDDFALEAFQKSSLGGLKPAKVVRERPTEAISVVELPAPDTDSGMPIWEVLAGRRSERSYTAAPLTLAEVSQLAWAACGTSEETRSLRTAPSAGALYPYETYLIAGAVEGLAPGIYRYEPAEHSLQLLFEGDFRAEFVEAALGQSWAGPAPVSFVWTGVPERCGSRYGPRAARYVNLDLGYVAQNIYLAAVALGLGTCSIGAFDDAAMNALVGADGQQELTVLAHPVGHVA